MSFWFVDTTARSAWAAATSQQGQLEALVALWAGDLWAKFYTSGGTHLATVTYGTPTIDTGTTPRAMVLGAWSAESHIVNGTAAYCILQVPAGNDILRADVTLAGAISDPGGRVRLDIGTTLRIQATSTLQEADLPAWRDAMAATDTLYEVGPTPGTQALTYASPGSAGMPGYSAQAAVTGQYSQMIDEYGGAVWAEDIGDFGAMLYCATGEDQYSEQIMSFSLSDASPAYSWFQQPGYATTLAAAQAAGSDLYYAGTGGGSDYTVLATAQKIDAYATEELWLAAWQAAGSTFPVGWKGWVYWRKPDTFTQASGSPWCFRYHTNQYIPPSFTGTANGAFLANQHNAYGPFRAWPPAFNTITDTEWSANVWGSGRRKFGLHAMDTQTKTWQRLSVWVPDMAYGGFTTYTHSARDDNAKRVYYLGTGGVYYADFTSGLAGVTMSAVTAYTGSAQTPYTEGNGALVWNDPGGRKLWYFQSASAANTLLMYDLVNQTITALDMSARGLSLPAKPGAWPAYYPYVPMLGGYDPDTNTVHFVNMQRGGPAHCHSFVVPASGETSASSYTISSRQLSLAGGVSYAAGSNTAPVWGYGDKMKYLPSLGVCLVPQGAGKMLAFRPS